MEHWKRARSLRNLAASFYPRTCWTVPDSWYGWLALQTADVRGRRLIATEKFLLWLEEQSTPLRLSALWLMPTFVVQWYITNYVIPLRRDVTERRTL